MQLVTCNSPQATLRTEEELVTLRTEEELVTLAKDGE